VHISGTVERNGHLYDAHEALQHEDYQILEWVLEISKPKIVTLEYFREEGLLREQLWRLRDIVPT